MHEIRASILPQYVFEVVQIAKSLGIERVAVSEVFIHGPEVSERLISIETSTPKARAFVEEFLKSPSLRQADYTLTSHELRAIVDSTPLKELTAPMGEPFPDILQDLWQLNQVNASYLGRCAAGALLLSTGLLHNDPVAIVVAALFLPFLPQVLAISFGAWHRDRGLTLQGAWSVITSILVALIAGAVVAAVEGGPIGYSNFKTPLASFAVSAVIGIAAGFSAADDAGRRYLIGVAAAVQFAIFPVWFGEAFVLGLPAKSIWLERLVCFLINLVTIAVCATVAYAALDLVAENRKQRVRPLLNP